MYTELVKFGLSKDRGMFTTMDFAGIAICFAGGSMIAVGLRRQDYSQALTGAALLVAGLLIGFA